MPTKTTVYKPHNEWRETLRYIYPNGCYPDYVTGALRRMAYRSSVSLDTDRRVRPSPLWLHPTYQSIQTEDHLTVGITREIGLGPYACGGRVEKIAHYYPEYATFARNPASVETDWALRARLKLKDNFQNLASQVAEYRETASMFSQFAKSTKAAWFDWRKRRRLWHGFKPTPCNVAAAELVYSYGIEPLANDVWNSLQRLNTVLAEPPIRRLCFTAKKVETFDSNGLVGRVEVTERPVIYYAINPEYASRFTIGNPAEMVWEIIPYSFVVDWGIPIGDYLSSLDALRGIEWKSGTKTRKERYLHWTTKDTPLVGKQTWIRMARREYRTHQRHVLSTVPMPNFPEWSPSRSFRAVMHGVSLLTQLREECNRPGKKR